MQKTKLTQASEREFFFSFFSGRKEGDREKREHGWHSGCEPGALFMTSALPVCVCVCWVSVISTRMFWRKSEGAKRPPRAELHEKESRGEWVLVRDGAIVRCCND